MSYVKNIDKDEIRSGFLVTSTLKRLWNVQIGLIVELQRVCKKYNLRFFADFGTLIGAARHRGFIPWDDDVDLIMFRDDYEKLKAVAPKEFKYPYRFDLWYENVEPEDKSPGWPRLPFIKIRDMRTMQLEDPSREQLHHEIWMDITPIVPAPPFKTHEQDFEFRKIQDVFLASCQENLVREVLQISKEGSFLLTRKSLETIFSMSLKEKGMLLEQMLTEFDFPAELVMTCSLVDLERLRRREWFDETIYMPFENIKIPVPKKFDEVLTSFFGDWHELVFQEPHTPIYSPDISYEDYKRIKNLPDDLSTRKNSVMTNSDELRHGDLVTIRQKKIWQVQLNLIEYVKNLGVKFFAIDETLHAAINQRGFDPRHDFVRFGITYSEFEKLVGFEIKFPYRLEKNRLSDDQTCMIDQNFSGGIHIEFELTDIEPEIIDVPFENILIPVPKNFELILKLFEPRFEKFKGTISPDISFETVLKSVRSTDSLRNIKEVLSE